MIVTETAKFSCNLWIDRTYFVQMKFIFRHSVRLCLLLIFFFRLFFIFSIAFEVVVVDLTISYLYLSISSHLSCYVREFQCACSFVFNILFMCVIICYLRLMPLPHYVRNVSRRAFIQQYLLDSTFCVCHTDITIHIEIFCRTSKRESDYKIHCQIEMKYIKRFSHRQNDTIRY